MIAGLGRAPAWKRLIEETKSGNRFYERPTPVGEWFAAQTAYLIAEELDLPFVNAVVVRLHDSWLVLVIELNQPLLLDGGSEQLVNLRHHDFL